MKSTKKSLLLSTLSLVLCFAMLLGTTYAWFTDEVKSGVNQIKAGNLDIEVSYKDGDEWKSIEGVDSLFSKGLWEPGHTEYVTLKIENKGTLALKYQMSVSPVTETSGTNAAGESFKLSDYLVFATTAASETEPNYADRDAARTAAGSEMKLNQVALSQPSTLLAKAASAAENPAEYITLVIYMPETVGNDANYKTGTTAPQIDLGITVVATQLTNESDSFGPDYDAITPWLGGTDAVPVAKEDGNIHIESAEQLAGLAAAVNAGDDYVGKTIVLDKNIDLNNVAWTPIGSSTHAFNGTFDGQNHTILNLNVNSDTCSGLFGNAFSHAHINNVKVVNATVSGHNKVGVILGGGYADITNCDVENATVTATTWKVNGNWDDGDKAGAIAGQIKESYAYTVKDCDVKNVTITGYRDVGGIAGYGYAENVFMNNTVTDATIINNREHNYNNYEADTEYDVREIVGEYSGTIDETNVATNVKIVKGESIGAAVKEAISEATEGATILLPTTDATIELPTTMNKGITIKGNGKDTIVAVEDNSKISGGATFENLTIETSNNAGTNGALSVTGGATFKDVTIAPAADGSTPKYAAVVSGSEDVVFENVDFALNGKTRGIMVWGGSPTIYVKNCTFDCVYPFNVDGGSPKFIVTDSTLNGWTSYGGTTTASFTNCKFGTSTSGYAYARPYTNTTFTNCEFSSDFLVDFGATGVVITLNNCTQNGSAVTTSIVDPDFQASGKIVIDGTETSYNK